ncbi:hypothetical protein [Aeromonas hydrophila]|uniref:hypothetical protein n=1 Tax=Aeromonas hydrophila TaxID=644 RepID=UPI002B49D00E|nr:hypothetical protein [Aeromonas hydrophila]
MIDWEHGVLADNKLCDAAKLVWIKLLGFGLNSSACVKVEQSILASVSNNYLEGLTQLRSFGYLKIKTKGTELLIVSGISLSYEIKIPLKNGDYYICDNEIIRCWAHKYPDASAVAVLRKVARWGEANPSKRKTRVGIESHITHFFENATQTLSDKPVSQKSKVDKAHLAKQKSVMDPSLSGCQLQTKQNDLFESSDMPLPPQGERSGNRCLASMQSLVNRNKGGM